jgi:chorismate mutase
MGIFKQLFGRKHQAVVDSVSAFFSDAPSWVKLDLEKVHAVRYDAELVVLLSHRNGYVREAAVIKAGELLLSTILPYLMPRINDWVPQVRQAANKSVEAYLYADKFDDVLDALPSVYWLRNCGRADHAAFIEQIEQFLIKNPKSSEIPVTLTKRTGLHARSLFDLSWKHNLAPKSALIRAGLASKDVPTSRRSCRAVHHLPENERLSFADELLKKKSGWLRYDGLLILSRLEPSRLQKEAEPNLLAEYAPLRELAERLSGWSKEQLASLRRDTLSNKQASSAAIRVAIKLCGILKDQGCEPILENFLLDERPSFRGAALLALTRISPGKFNEKVFEFLKDKAPAASHAAVVTFVEGKFL